jgi:hypothetical protein
MGMGYGKKNFFFFVGKKKTSIEITLDKLFENFQTPEGLIALLLALVILAPYVFFFFRKGIIKQVVEEGGIATLKDLNHLAMEWDAKWDAMTAKMDAQNTALSAKMDALNAQTDAKMDALDAKTDALIQQLRMEQKADLQQLKENDLNHIHHEMQSLRKEMNEKWDALYKNIIAIFASQKK